MTPARTCYLTRDNSCKSINNVCAVGALPSLSQRSIFNGTSVVVVRSASQHSARTRLASLAFTADGITYRPPYDRSVTVESVQKCMHRGMTSAVCCRWRCSRSLGDHSFAGG